MSRGKIQIVFDNREPCREIVSKITKASIYSQDTGAKIAQIKSLVNKIKFKVDISLLKGQGWILAPHSRVSLKCLIKECDENS